MTFHSRLAVVVEYTSQKCEENKLEECCAAALNWSATTVVTPKSSRVYYGTGDGGAGGLCGERSVCVIVHISTTTVVWQLLLVALKDEVDGTFTAPCAMPCLHAL